MSNSNTKTNKANRIIVINVKKGGELYLNRDGFSHVDRVVSIEKLVDGSLDVALLAKVDDVWRFTTTETLDLGSAFSCRLSETKHRYFYINKDYGLTSLNKETNAAICADKNFVRINLTTSLTLNVYKQVINALTLGRNLVNVTNNTPFNIRNMSGENETHLTNHTFAYLLNVGFNKANKFEVREVTCLTHQEARSIMSRGLNSGECLLRQLFVESNALMVNFNKAYSEAYMTGLLSLLKEKIPMIGVVVSKNRYNFNINVDEVFNEKRPTELEKSDNCSDPVLEVQTPEEKGGQVLSEAENEGGVGQADPQLAPV